MVSQLGVWQRRILGLFHLRPATAVVMCGALFFAIAAIDILTPPELNLSLLYVVVILIATWNAGLTAGLAFAIGSSFVQYLALSAYPAPVLFSFYWWVWLLDRWGTFFVVVALTHPLELLFRRHEAASRIDGLTGAANQQYFRELLDREINRSARSGGTFSVALVDCDDFRLINDEFGNVVGDAVLRTIADAITKCIRRSDTAARLGGDEFAILLPDSTIDNAREIVQRLRGKLLEHKLNDWTITLSIGLASFQGSRLDAEGIIAFCDSLIDRAKRSGKGQIAAEQAPDVPDDADATSLGRRTPEVSISRRTGQ